jgi:hypothetical protein
LDNDAFCNGYPQANGWPHYVHTGHECHLYATDPAAPGSNGSSSWVLSFAFAPDDPLGVEHGACMFATPCVGAVPVGGHRWVSYFEEEVTVTAREAAAAEVAAVQEANARLPPRLAVPSPLNPCSGAQRPTYAGESIFREGEASPEPASGSGPHVQVRLLAEAATQAEPSPERCGHSHARLCTSFVVLHTEQTWRGGGDFTAPVPWL